MLPCVDQPWCEAIRPFRELALNRRDLHEVGPRSGDGHDPVAMYGHVCARLPVGTSLAGLPNTRWPAATFFMTTEPSAMELHSPIVSPAATLAFMPTSQPSPRWTRPAILAPGATVEKRPRMQS